jgi:hypothetical protein
MKLKKYSIKRKLKKPESIGLTYKTLDLGHKNQITP